MTSKKLSGFASPLTIAFATLALTGCGQGFKSASGAGATSNSSSSLIGTPQAQTSFQSLTVDGTVSGYDSTQVIEIDKKNMMLIVRLPSPIPSLMFTSAVMPIDKIPGATISAEPLSGGGSALTVRIPLSALIKGIAFASPSHLPNGDALPGVPDGELPSVAVNLSKAGSMNPTIYLGPSVIGIYVNSPYSLPIGLTLPIRNKAHTRTWGYVSSIPAKGADKGGFFVSLALPDDIARIIDDVI